MTPLCRRQGLKSRSKLAKKKEKLFHPLKILPYKNQFNQCPEIQLTRRGKLPSFLHLIWIHPCEERGIWREERWTFWQPDSIPLLTPKLGPMAGTGDEEMDLTNLCLGGAHSLKRKRGVCDWEVETDIGLQAPPARQSFKWPLGYLTTSLSSRKGTSSPLHVRLLCPHWTLSHLSNHSPVSLHFPRLPRCFALSRLTGSLSLECPCPSLPPEVLSFSPIQF